MTETRPWPLISPNHGVLINHVSDTHFGYRPWSYSESDHMLRDYREGLIPPVDLFLHTGDITEAGTTAEDAYAREWLDEAIDDAAELVCMGNHDIRDRVVHTRTSWEQAYGRSANTFVDVRGVRFVTFAVDDFTGDHTHWVIPEATWSWADSVIGSFNGPVIFANHYPPLEIGTIQENAIMPQVRLHELFGDHPNLVGMMCGHLHKDLTDPRAATFVTLGGRPVPLLTDISAMLSLEGEPGRDQSAKVQSTSAYVEVLPEMWRVRYRRHGSHAWGGLNDQRTTTLDLIAGTVTRGQA